MPVIPVLISEMTIKDNSDPPPLIPPLLPPPSTPLSSSLPFSSLIEYYFHMLYLYYLILQNLLKVYIIHMTALFEA
jgi:hypothetical protein